MNSDDALHAYLANAGLDASHEDEFEGDDGRWCVMLSDGTAVAFDGATFEVVDYSFDLTATNPGE